MSMTPKGQGHDMFVVIISVIIVVLNKKLLLYFSPTIAVGFGFRCSF